MLTSTQIDQNEQLTEEYGDGRGFSNDFESYLDAIIEARRLALQARIEQRSIMANSIHRGTKE